MLSTMADQIVAEHSALTEEIEDFKAIVAILEERQPAPTTNEQQQRSQKMQMMLNHRKLMQSKGIAAGLRLLAAKDSNVTGGSVSNVTGVSGKTVSLVDRQ